MPLTDRRLHELRLAADEAGRHEEAHCIAGLSLAMKALERIRDGDGTPEHIRRAAAEAWAKITWTPPEPIGSESA